MAKKIAVKCLDGLFENGRTHIAGDIIIVDADRFKALGSLVEHCKELKVVSTPAGDVIAKQLDKSQEDE